MATEDRIDGAKRLLDRVASYNRMIIADSFEPATVDNLKGNAKDLCDAVRAEVDNIKAEIDSWS